MLRRATPEPAAAPDPAAIAAAKLARAVAVLAAAPDRTEVLDLLWRAGLVD